MWDGFPGEVKSSSLQFCGPKNSKTGKSQVAGGRVPAQLREMKCALVLAFVDVVDSSKRKEISWKNRARRPLGPKSNELFPLDLASALARSKGNIFLYIILLFFPPSPLIQSSLSVVPRAH